MPDTGFSGTASANTRSAGTASADPASAGTASSGAGARLDGTISASGRKITFVANHPGMSPRGRSVGGADICWIAQEIADVGVSVTVRGPDRAIARLDDVDVPVARRVLTGSPHIRLGSPASPLPDARMPRFPDAPAPGCPDAPAIALSRTAPFPPSPRRAGAFDALDPPLPPRTIRRARGDCGRSS